MKPNSVYVDIDPKDALIVFDGDGEMSFRDLPSHVKGLGCKRYEFKGGEWKEILENDK
jgi:hypothetical protein